VTSPTYLARFREIVRERGWPETTTPTELLDRWTGLVEAAEEGYRWTIDGYLNELAARDVLEVVLADDSLRDEPEVSDLRARVAAADRRLRAVLRGDVQIGEPDQPWWRRGVLRRAGDDYVEDLERIYGIRVSAD
jgi:hypothetical protein